MLKSIPISSQPNAPFSKNPKGIHESGQGVGDFQSAFAAAAAVRRDTDGFSQTVSKVKSGGKADCRDECDSLKDSDSPAPAESPEAERSDEVMRDHGEETFKITPLLIEEDQQQAVEPNLLMGLLSGEQVVPNNSVSESLKSEISLSGTPESSLDVNSQNPIMDKKNHIPVTFPLSEGKRNIKKLITQPDTEKKAGPNLGDVGVKLPVNEAERQSADVKSILEFHRDVNSERVEIGHAVKGIENSNNATVKTSRPEAIADVAKEKVSLNPSWHLDSPWTGPSKKTEEFSYGPTISHEAGRSKEPDKKIHSSSISSIPTKATEKHTAVAGGVKNEPASFPRGGGTGEVTLGENRTAIKESMEIKAVAGSGMNAGDRGAVSKNSALPSDFRPAMESNPGEVKTVETGDRNQKDSSLKTHESSGRLVNVGETKTQPSKAGSDPSSSTSSIPTRATEKHAAVAGGVKNEPASFPRGGGTGEVTLGENRTAIKESMEIKAVAGSGMNAGDRGAVSKNSALPSDFRPAMESNPGEVKTVETGDRNQKDSSLKTHESSGRLVNVGETKTQPSKAGSDPSSSTSSIPTRATEKHAAVAGGVKNEPASFPRGGGTGEVTLGENRTAIKESMEIKAVAGNGMNAGDRGAVSKNSALPSDFRPAMESNPGEVKTVETRDRNQKDSSLKAHEPSGRPVNVGETKTQPSKAGSDPSSSTSSIPTRATEKHAAVAGGAKNAMPFFPGRRHKGEVTLGENRTAIKESMEIKAVAGNGMNAGDRGAVSKNSALPSDFRPAMESISGEVKMVETSDRNQKDSSLKAHDSSGRLVNVGETEAQPSKPGSDHREGQGETEKRNGAQGKDFHGTLEKLSVTKGEDVPPISKARYGSDNGTHAVMPETEKEIPKSPGGKDGLGTLVRTTAFLLKNGRQEARMALNPESLGHLKIRISTENQQVTVKVMAETVAAKEMLEQNLHQLKTDFQNQGLEISKFDVSLSQDSDRNGAGQNPSFASNRTKDKSGHKKEENPRQSEKSKPTASNANRVRHNDSVDFFA